MVRASLAWLVLVTVAGCFTPKLGEGAVACGQAGLCPTGYHCHAADERCYTTPDPGATGDMSVADDGAAPPHDLAGVDLAGADLSVSMCTKAQCGLRNCGTIPDGCGGKEICGGGCQTPKTCGGGNPGTPNICGSGPACTKITTCPSGACGYISNGCDDVIDCGMCPTGQECGSDSKCH